MCVCACVYESSEASAYSFGLATNPNPTRARSYPLNINPKPDPKPESISGPAGSGRVADLYPEPSWMRTTGLKGIFVYTLKIIFPKLNFHSNAIEKPFWFSLKNVW